jgi:hypothetical protein
MRWKLHTWICTCVDVNTYVRACDMTGCYIQRCTCQMQYMRCIRYIRTHARSLRKCVHFYACAKVRYVHRNITLKSFMPDACTHAHTWINYHAEDTDIRTYVDVNAIRACVVVHKCRCTHVHAWITCVHALSYVHTFVHTVIYVTRTFVRKCVRYMRTWGTILSVIAQSFYAPTHVHTRTYLCVDTYVRTGIPDIRTYVQM